MWLAEKEKMGSKDSDSATSNGGNSGAEEENDVANITGDAKIDKIILSVDNVESVSNGLLILDIFLETLKVPVHAINLKTLTERTADLLHASMMDDLTPDHSFNSLNSILSIFKIFVISIKFHSLQRFCILCQRTSYKLCWTIPLFLRMIC